MMSMVERVAQAIQAKLDYEFAERGGLAADEMAVMAARAAIEAMREPTEAMVRVGRKKIPAGHGQAGIYTGDAYTAMIDAALNEQVAG